MEHKNRVLVFSGLEHLNVPNEDHKVYLHRWTSKITDSSSFFKLSIKKFRVCVDSYSKIMVTDPLKGYLELEEVYYIIIKYLNESSVKKFNDLIIEMFDELEDHPSRLLLLRSDLMKLNNNKQVKSYQEDLIKSREEVTLVDGTSLILEPNDGNWDLKYKGVMIKSSMSDDLVLNIFQDLNVISKLLYKRGS